LGEALREMGFGVLPRMAGSESVAMRAE
jgi:hypothetical protein